MKKVPVLATAIMALFLSIATSEAISASPDNMMISIKAGPPAAVLNSFVAIFGNVPVAQWKLRSDGNWRAHFMKNGVEWEATFTTNGALIKSEAAN